MPPQTVLIVGASKGLGLSLVKKYSKEIGSSNVFATIREENQDNSANSENSNSEFPKGLNIIENIDVSNENVGEKIIKGLNGKTINLLIYVSGILKSEKIEKLNWKDELSMYTICSIAPVFIIQSLLMSSSFAPDSKVMFLTSEAGSITLRTQGEGGGMYGHHGSKAAANMVGHILSYDLKERGITIAMIHPGFLKTGMTKDAGMEEFYEKMGAVTPDEAAVPFYEFAEKLNMDMTGKFWAPMGARGIGNAEEVLGKEWTKQPGPHELPW
ncbi:uncharacterized protein I206_103032 [Kwoniella pini CBS 10737]|uniref:Cytoplasmic protein n=1 Tax=Kwoniella pini CBS 10737 TaxID=1296096 RepID=A0A1B9IBC0_9TREE|nr:cytoplasmic protein [Kwoniella pini CBS 10737]OCF52670.1 cytoplasmic protein [Kwoniella pini CBS 10737]